MEQATFRVGVSGHQHIGDDTTIAFVSQQLRELLGTYKQQAIERGQNIVACSALALGTDQLFISIALELGIPVEVVIPCVHYEEIFTSHDSVQEYHRLLNAAQHIYRLPSHDCSDDAYLAAGQWIVEHSDIVLLVWNGYPAAGRGGTADVASYARLKGCPFIHIHTRSHTVKQYSSSHPDLKEHHVAAKRKFAVSKNTVYQGQVLTVNQYHLVMPNGDKIERDIVERPESVLVLPVGQKGTVLLIEEYDLGAETWQLTLPGEKSLIQHQKGYSSKR